MRDAIHREKTVKNPIRRARPERTGIGAPLGDLELSVMRYIWGCNHDGCQGADVQQALDRERPVALTTILTTLDRLREKEILRREREGKAYRYWPMVTEEQLQERIVAGIMERLISQFPKAVAAYLAQRPLPGEANDAADLSVLAQQVNDLRAEDTGDY